VDGPATDIDDVVKATRDERSADDATLLLVRRHDSAGTTETPA
jgi:hypothetical protein